MDIAKILYNNPMTKDQKEVIDYWIKTAEETLNSAKDLLKLKHYDHSLFFCHLALEKLIKGLVLAKTGSHSLPIHDLVKLSRQANLMLSQDSEEDLAEMTTWNISARYDNIKRDFYHKATKQFTENWFKKAERIFLWLKSQY